MLWRCALATLFTWLISLQFFIIVSHDLVNVPGWVHGSQVQAQVGRGKVWLATLINSLFSGVAAALALLYWHRPRPASVPNYWILYCAVAVLSAIGMWYIPYFRGAPEKIKRTYLHMYAGTRQILPARGDNPRPNAFHLGLHVLFVLTLSLALALRFRH